MEMRIKKRPSLKKINNSKQKPMNLTMTSAMFSTNNLKESKLPPLRSNMRKTSVKFNKKIETKERQETETTTLESEMFQSYYQSMSNGWVKPSQYIKDIKQINLINEPGLQVSNYAIKLNEKMEKNMSKIESLFKLMEKWISILKKAISYTTSKKTNTPYLMQEIRFWRILSKKFDELQYQFNNQKTADLVNLMKNSLKAKPQYRKCFEQFIFLKDKIVLITPLLQKLYLSLEQTVTGSLQRFQQSSNIISSIQLLKKSLLTFQMITENNQIIRMRSVIMYEKMGSSMNQKLSAAPLYPRQLANISSIKQKYETIDKALSFYSNFLAILEQSPKLASQEQQYSQLIESIQYTRDVLVNLLQILGYFEFLYKKKQVLEFSKLFSNRTVEKYYIFDIVNEKQWKQYMGEVFQSMERKAYQI